MIAESRMDVDVGERIGTLRDRCLDRKKQGWNPWQRGASAVAMDVLKASEHEPSWRIRRGLLARERLSRVTFELDDLELLVGRVRNPNEGMDPARVAAAEAYLRPWLPMLYPGGQQGHCEVDYPLLFELGIGGLRRRVEDRRRAAQGVTAETLASFVSALDGFSVFCERAAEAAESARLAASGSRREELAEMARSCRRIAGAPPAGFRDAIQLMGLVMIGLYEGDGVGLVVPGHMDRTLRRFYDEDVRAGRLDRQGALCLVEALYLLINDSVPDGLAVSVMVGGRDSAGQDMTHDLSYLCLEALRRTGLIYPTVGVCWHAGTPSSLTELAIDLIGKGYSTPAFFGDETIQKGLQRYGASAGDACYYINSTCVEITPCGASNVWVASPYFNLGGYLLEEIAQQASAESPACDFEAFVESYKDRLASKISGAVAEQNRLRDARQRYGGKPLQSVLTRDCVERGRDIDDGGALYNWVECSFVGLANLADSLLVIREEVFDRKHLDLDALKSILDRNFEEHEAVRQRFLHKYPKYGQGDARADELVSEFVEFVGMECARYRVHPDGSRFVPGAFVWVMHERLGRETGATPDGRKAGVPFADGCGPAQGRESRGPTASILSTTSWDHSAMIGGLAYNMKFSAELFKDPASFARLRDMVLTFLNRGGFETQINVVDAGVLLKAREDPESYRDLVVRIGGYTDYFARLSPQMQEEVISRTGFTDM